MEKNDEKWKRENSKSSKRNVGIIYQNIFRDLLRRKKQKSEQKYNSIYIFKRSFVACKLVLYVFCFLILIL